MNSPQKLRRVLHSRHFRVSFFVLAGVWLLALAVTAVSAVLRTRNTVRGSVQDEMNNMVLALSDIFDATRTNAVSLGSLSSVEAALSLPNPDLDVYITMSNDICSTMEVYSYLSVDLFMENTRKVFVSQRGMYTYTDYMGQDIIDLIREPQPYEVWLLGRAYTVPFGNTTDTPCITYLKRLPVYNSHPDGYVAFHIPLDAIRQNIQNALPPYPGELLVDFNGGVLYSGSGTYAPGTAYPSAEELDALCAQRSSQLLTSSLDSELRCSYLVPNAYVRHECLQALGTVLPPFFLAMVLILAGSFGYSLVMLRPLEHLIRQAGGPVYEGDEFERMRHTMSGLNSCIELLTDELRRNLPFIQERYITDLALNYTDVAAVKSTCEAVGLSFPYENFAVILTAFPAGENPQDSSLREKHNLFVRTEAQHLFGGFGLVYVATLAENQLLFLLNTHTAVPAASLAQACHQLSLRLRGEISPAPVFSVGICPAGDTVPYHAYLQARNNIAFSPEDAQGGLVLAENRTTTIAALDPKTTNRIVDLVLDQDMPPLEQYLRQTFTKLTGTQDGTDTWQRLSILCVGSTLARMIELELDPAPDRAASAIKKLVRADSAQSCLDILLSYFSAVITTDRKLPEEASNHVSKAIAFMQAHYTEDISIPQIAESVALNPVYLNKLFKLSTGKTLSDYLNLYRIEVAKNFLAQTDLPLNAISEKVGYNDVRSLLRYFKKYNGLSPTEYRHELAAGAPLP